MNLKKNGKLSLGVALISGLIFMPAAPVTCRRAMDLVHNRRANRVSISELERHQH